MAGCTYKDCTSKRDGFTHMFRYPISDKLRCQQWLINAQKLDYFRVQQPKNRLICQHHFRDDNFQNRVKNRLKIDAIPTLDGPFCGSYNSLNVMDFQQGHCQNEISISEDDEIEIEEHDVLENPNIKRIFPDLSVIKKEISVYEEGLIPIAAKVKQEIISEISECNPNVQQDIQECNPTVQYCISEYNQIVQQHVPECKPIVQQHIPENKPIVQQHLLECKPIVQQNVTECKPIIQQHVPEYKPILQQQVPQYKSIVQQHIPECKSFVQPHISECKPNIQQHIDSIPTPPLETKINKTTQQTPIMLSLLTSTKTTTEVPSDNNLATHLRFKTFLDSLVDDSLDINDNSCDSNSSNDTEYLNDNTPSDSCDMTESSSSSKDLKFVRNNIFILGSKPSDIYPKNPSKNIRPVKVVLKDISSYLNRSKQYCKKCSILYPNIEALNCHTNEIHSPTKKIFISKDKLQQSSNKLALVDNKIECDICYVKFSSKGNLTKHQKRFHYKKTRKELHSSLQRETKKSDSVVQANNKTDVPGNHYCFHCTKHFESHNSLIEHLYEVINPDIKVSSKHESNQNSTKEDVADGDTNSVSKLVPKKNPCSICSLEFSNQRDLRYHFKENHIDDNSKTNHKYTSNKRKVAEQAHYVKKAQDSFKEQLNHKNGHNVKRNKREYVRNNIDENTDNDEIEQELSSTEYDSKFSDQETGHENSDANIQGKELYQCFICSKYTTYFKTFCAHMSDHNINLVVDVDKTVFNPHCKFCNLKFADIKSYNKHLLIEHIERKDKKIELDIKAFQSVLFECMKCNIFFLSANAAKSHSAHKEIFLNWSCSDCQRTFKANDKPLHLKQHLISKNITAYTLSDSALKRVLFKCLKCAVHFSEDEYVVHSTTCGLEAPNSVYCKICDILINKNDMDGHEHNHKYKKSDASDFTIVESPLFVNKAKRNTAEKMNPFIRSKFGLNFCSSCNCFISDMGSTRKAHVEGRCGVICQRTCKKCGLIFTNRGYLSHKSMHDEVKNLSMQAFHFYDINTKMQIRPPMPKYPKCNICKVHFLNKQIIKEHECTQQKFTTCNICNTKFTEVAFKLHMNYHNYKLSSAKKIVIKYEQDDDVNNKDISSKTKSKETGSPPDLNIVKEKAIEQSSNLYSCVCCLIILDNYDKVVQHCQVHYGYKGTRTNEQTKAKENDEKLLSSLKFDPFYFRFDKNLWFKHIFGKLSTEEIEKKVQDSIYKFECRLIMEEIQSGPSDLILYKCDSCRSYIDPSNIYLHVETTCKAVKKYPCPQCGLNFHSAGYRSIHEKVHERYGISKASYKIVHFNKKEHQQFTKIMYKSRDKFILYQCRNCESIVEKLQRDQHQCYHATIFKCPYCGLLFYEQEYEYHLIKHKTINYFDNDHIIVIMFGKLDVRKSDALRPTFNGAVYDLTFYKCENCGLCLETKNEMTTHICVDTLSKSICPKCRLCFLKKALHAHLKLHERRIELEYSDFCSNVVSFNTSTIEINDNEPIEDEQSKQNENSNTEQNIKSSSCLKEILYKCKCGLHFLEEKNAIKHTTNCQPKAKISKQSCFRCDLLFTPGELFNHLLKHHSNKKLKYQYNIITTYNGNI